MLRIPKKMKEAFCFLFQKYNLKFLITILEENQIKVYITI